MRKLLKVAAIHAVLLPCIMSFWWLVSFSLMAFARLCRGDFPVTPTPVDRWYALLAAVLLTAAHYLVTIGTRQRVPVVQLTSPLEPLLAGGGLLADEAVGFLIDPAIEQARIRMINMLGVPADLLQPVFATAPMVSRTLPLQQPGMDFREECRRQSVEVKMAAEYIDNDPDDDDPDDEEEDHDTYDEDDEDDEPEGELVASSVMSANETMAAPGLPTRLADPNLPPESDWAVEVTHLATLMRQFTWFADYGESQSVDTNRAFAEIEEAARAAAVAGHRKLAKQVWLAIAPGIYEWPV